MTTKIPRVPFQSCPWYSCYLTPFKFTKDLKVVNKLSTNRERRLAFRVCSQDNSNTDPLLRPRCEREENDRLPVASPVICVVVRKRELYLYSATSRPSKCPSCHHRWPDPFIQVEVVVGKKRKDVKMVIES